MDLDKATKKLKEGKLIVYPTETAYGIGADATNEGAVTQVYEAKQRPLEKGLTVIVKDLEQAEKYTELSEKEKVIVKEFMPGPLTLVAEKKDNLPALLNDKFVFRISSSKIARNLAEEFPIVATSANISGRETSYSVEDIDPELLKHISAVLDEGKLEKKQTSTIVEVIDGEVVVHREGPIKKKEIEKIL